MICNHCEKIGIRAENLTRIYDGNKVCKNCLDEHYFECDRCNEYFPKDDVVYDYDDVGYCDDCFYELFFHCANCDSVCDRDCGYTDGDGDLYCEDCYENGYCDDEEQEDPSQQMNERTKKFQNNEKGKVIDSKRTFGVELEVLGKASEVQDSIDNAFGLVGDGSIRVNKEDGYQGGFELVSPVMKGKAGEDGIVDACKILNNNDIGLNASCGMHVHLGAGDFLPLQEKDYNLTVFGESDYKNNNYQIYYIPKKVFQDNFKGKLKDLIENLNEIKSFYQIKTNRQNSGIFYYCTPRDIWESPPKSIPKHKKDDIAIYIKQKTESTENLIEKLKNLFLFYIAFESFLFATQARSRREGNKYTQSLQKSFSFQDITSIQTVDEFEKCWYKNTKKRDISQIKNNHYHDSRYYSVNFHALFETKKGNHTLEIRLHGGTKNATKILNWVNLHQTILDKIKSESINQHHIRQAHGIFLLEEKIDYFFSILRLKPEVEKYFRKRIRTFTLQIKKRAEVSDDE